MSKKIIKPSKEPNFKQSLNLIHNKWFFVVLIFVLVFITYGNSIKNDYNLDDGYVVSLDEGNLQTQKGIKGIPELLFSNYSNGPGVTYGYRPFGKITLAIEYSLWGNNPNYSHLVNVLFFALNVILIYFFLLKIAALFHFENKIVLYLATILFIVHPIHTEVVCSIKNREEILAFTFAIASWLTLFKYLETKNKFYFLLISLLIILAYLSKENGFTAIPILFIISFFYFYQTHPENTLIKTIKTLLSTPFFWLLIISITIGFYTIVKLSTSVSPSDIGYKFETTPTYFFDPSHMIPNGFQTLFFYVKKLFIPFPLLYYYGYDMLPDRGWNSVFPYAGIVTVLIILFFVVHSIIKRRHLFEIFWLLFFIVTIFIFSNIKPAPPITGIVAERFVFQSSLAFVVLVSGVLVFLSNYIKQKFNLLPKLTHNQLLLFLSLFIILPYFSYTVYRNTLWYNKSTLFENDIKYLSNSVRANFMIGGHIMSNYSKSSFNNIDGISEVYRAKQYFEKSLQLYPKCDDAWIALGKVYRSYLNNPDSAIACWNRVDTLHKFTYLNAIELIGNVYYFDKQEDDKALNYYMKSFSIYNKNKLLYQKIIDILLKQEKYEEILPLSEIALQNFWIDGFINRGDAYLNLKDTVAAVQNYEAALAKGFKSDVLLKNLDYYYSIHGKKSQNNSLPN